MYASKPDQFLFIKSNKTAGTSLEIALSRCLSSRPEQFFTPLSFKDEQLRQNLSGRTFSATMNSIFPTKRSTAKRLRAKIAKGLDSLGKSSLKIKNELRREHHNKTDQFFLMTGFHTHSTYSECLKSQPDFSEYWSCVFARHPYKRFLSHLTWRTKSVKNIQSWSVADWKSHAKDNIDNFCKRNLLHYSYDRKSHSYVNTILAFENLKESTNLICEKISLQPGSVMAALPKTKSGFSNAISNINPVELLGPDIRSKLLKNEEFLFDEMGYKDSLDDFSPSRAWLQTSGLKIKASPSRFRDL